MKKSMYFYVRDNSMEGIIENLECIPVEFQKEMRGESIIFVFPDLPVRIYAEIRKIFGSDCLQYRRFRSIERRRMRQ